MESNTDKLREEFARIAHESWIGWMECLLSRCGAIGNWDSVFGGTVYIPKDFIERWTRQMKTPYSELPESEKESDRHQADKYLEAMNNEK